MFGQVWMFMEKNGIEVAGPPFAVYHDYDQENGVRLPNNETGGWRRQHHIVRGPRRKVRYHRARRTYEKIMVR